MRYLVTGAQGFTGRFTCAALLASDPHAFVVGTGRSPARDAFTHRVSWGTQLVTAPFPAEVRALDRARYRYVRCDLGDAAALAALVDESAPDAVIHLAAALRDDAPEALVRSNVEGTAALVRALGASPRPPRLVLGSSGSVYGVPTALPVTEDQRCAPDEPYAASKLASELTARILARGASVPLTIARIFNIAGPGQDERHVCGRFAAQAAAIRLAGAPAEIAVGDLRPTRDFIDVRDVAGALVALATNGRADEIYNVAGGVETAIGDVLTLVLRAAGLEGKVRIATRYVRDGDFARAVADCAKLHACGFLPRYPLPRTVADVVDYYLTEVATDRPGGASTSAAS